MNSILLATDLDDTLVGDETALQTLNEVVIELRESINLKFVYVTGRSKKSFNNLRKEHHLLEPDALIASVGTEIYLGKGLSIINEWPITGSWDIDSVKQTLSGINELTLQPESEQRPFKISFYAEEKNNLILNIRKHLTDFDANIIYSGGQYLDILPKDINKGAALNYLCKYWRLSSTDTIACGDSANDIAMLAKYKSIIVGNAQKDLLNWYNNNKSENIYHSSKNYAAGILDGLHHFSII